MGMYILIMRWKGYLNKLVILYKTRKLLNCIFFIKIDLTHCSYGTYVVFNVVKIIDKYNIYYIKYTK